MFDSVVAALKKKKYEPKGARFRATKWDTDLMPFHKLRNKAMSRPGYDHKRWSRRKRKIRLKSWRKWANNLIVQSVEAVKNHDFAKESQILKALGRKHSPRHAQPSTHPRTNNVLPSTKAKLEQWAKHCEAQLAGPGYADLEPLPDRSDEILTDDTLERAASRAKLFKDAGRDQTALESFLKVPSMKAQLFSLVRDVWRTEVAPTEMLEIAQVMLWKGVKRKEDRSGYRPISITNAAYKLLALVLLDRLERETRGYLHESQAGARKGMTCLHPLTVIRLTMERLLKTDVKLALL